MANLANMSVFNKCFSISEAILNLTLLGCNLSMSLVFAGTNGNENETLVQALAIKKPKEQAVAGELENSGHLACIWVFTEQATLLCNPGTLHTSIFRKPADRHSRAQTRSFHPEWLKDNVPGPKII